MNSMINIFLENAKQAVVRGKTALTPVYSDPYYDSGNFSNYGTGDGVTYTPPAEDITPGFRTGEELPPAWE